MSKTTAKKVWRWIARILWTWGIANLAVVAILWWATSSSGLPSDLGFDAQMVATNVILLIVPALTISIVLRIAASRQAKEARIVPHEAPLSMYEHPLRE